MVSIFVQRIQSPDHPSNKTSFNKWIFIENFVFSTLPQKGGAMELYFIPLSSLALDPPINWVETMAVTTVNPSVASLRGGIAEDRVIMHPSSPEPSSAPKPERNSPS